MQLSNPSNQFASLAVLIAAAIWGLYWIPLRYLAGLGVREDWAVALINIPAACVALILFLWQLRSQLPHLRRGALIGIFMGLTVALFTIGLVLSSVVRVTLLFYLAPIWSTLIGSYWLKEDVTRGRWIAIAIGLLGLGFLVSQGGGQVPLNIGDVLGFLSGITWAVGGAMIKRYGEVPMPTLLLFQFCLASIFALLFGALWGPSLGAKPGAFATSRPRLNCDFHRAYSAIDIDYLLGPKISFPWQSGPLDDDRSHYRHPHRQLDAPAGGHGNGGMDRSLPHCWGLCGRDL